MPKHPKSENEQYELYGPRSRSVMEPVICAERALNDLINAVAICCVQGLKDKKGSFADAKKIAKESFAAFVANPKSQTEEGWSNFFVQYVEGRNLGIGEKSLKSLKKRLDNLNQKQRIIDLFEVRRQCQALLENKPKELSKESVEKIRELLYDLTFPHI